MASNNNSDEVWLSVLYVTVVSSCYEFLFLHNNKVAFLILSRMNVPGKVSEYLTVHLSHYPFQWLLILVNFPCQVCRRLWPIFLTVKPFRGKFLQVSIFHHKMCPSRNWFYFVFLFPIADYVIVLKSTLVILCLALYQNCTVKSKENCNIGESL